MKTARGSLIALSLLAGTALLLGCPSSGIVGGAVTGAVGGLVSDCFGEDSISESEYDDLNAFEQLLYEQNDCGRYEPRLGLIGDILD